MKRRNFIINIIYSILGIYFAGSIFNKIKTNNNISIKNNDEKIKNNYTVGFHRLSKLTINVTDHCNLRCKSCDAFSPIAKPVYLKPKKLEKDLKAFRKIVGNNIKKIGLLGGEPLLNKNINEILRICRHYFPEPVICLVTNGILLKNMSDDFWQTCKNNNISISVSVYPININFNEMKELAEKNQVDIYFNNVKYEGNEFDLKTGKKLKNKFYLSPDLNANEFQWGKPIMDLSGKQNIQETFKKCHSQPRVCTMFIDGKIYSCYIASQIHHFNNFFKTNLELLEEDYLDIYKVKNIEEILEFLETPKPFCRYCIYDHYGCISWDYSKLDIKEWT